MTTIIRALSEGTWPALVTALLHTLWQGAVAAILLAMALRLLPARRARWRYGLALLALLAVVQAGLITWALGDRAAGNATGDRRPAARQALGTGADPSTGAALPAAAANRSQAVAPGPTKPAAADPIAPPAPAEGGARNSAAGAARGDDSGATHSSAVGSATAAPESSTPLTGISWTAWAAVIWLGGAVLMLGRLARLMAGVRRLRRQSRRVIDPALLAMVEQLCVQMRLRRPVRLATGAHLDIPAVIGIVWPVILLPAAMISELSIDQLRLIVAHELAHVRRWDYLVNVGQFVIEALLFFNPAVWWISRQVRVEREACCDATAIAVTGRQQAYAQTLYHVALSFNRQAVEPAAAAMALGRRPSTLLDRLRRIAQPEQRPRAALPWYSLVALVTASVVLIGGLRSVNEQAVALAANWLSDGKGMEQLVQIKKDFGTPIANYQPDSYYPRPYNDAWISGKLHTADGQPLPAGTRLSGLSEWEQYHCGVRYQIPLAADGSFRYPAPFGRIHLTASAPGYAPTFAPIIKPLPGQDVEGLDLALAPGFTGQVQVRDVQGQPMANARIVVGYGQWCIPGPIELTTDRTGSATVAHAAVGEIVLDIPPEGYQCAQRATLAPGTPGVFTVQPTRDTTITVVEQKEGAEIGVPGAKVRLVSTQGDRHRYYALEDAPVLATTDATGRCTVATFSADQEYDVLIDPPAPHRKDVLIGVKVGGQRTKEIVREDPVAVRIVGPADRLGRLTVPNVSGLAVRSRRWWSGTTGPRFFDSIEPVALRDGQGLMTVEPWGNHINDLLVDPGYEAVRIRSDRKPGEILVDLKPKTPMRPVRIQFEYPEGSPPPIAQVEVNLMLRGSGQRQLIGPEAEFLGQRVMPIRNGRIELEAPVGYEIHAFPHMALGYSMDSMPFVPIRPGDGLQVIPMRTAVSGAIFGRVLDAKGDPIVVSGSVTAFELPADKANGGPSMNVNMDAQPGRFMATPLPIPGTYGISFSQGRNVQTVGPFTLDAEHPIREIEVRMVEGKDLTLQVVDPAGQGVASARVTLTTWYFPHRKGAGGISGTESPLTVTGPDGRFTIPDINTKADVKYTVKVAVDRDYEPTTVDFEPGQPPAEIRLSKRGLGVTGKVVDKKTGQPVAGISIQAVSAFSMTDGFGADAPSNGHGEFHFSNLPAGTYSLKAVGQWSFGGNWQTRDVNFTIDTGTGKQTQSFEAGQAVPLVVTVNISNAMTMGLAAVVVPPDTQQVAGIATTQPSATLEARLEKTGQFLSTLLDAGLWNQLTSPQNPQHLRLWSGGDEAPLTAGVVTATGELRLRCEGEYVVMLWRGKEPVAKPDTDLLEVVQRATALVFSASSRVAPRQALLRTGQKSDPAMTQWMWYEPKMLSSDGVVQAAYMPTPDGGQDVWPRSVYRIQVLVKGSDVALVAEMSRVSEPYSALPAGIRAQWLEEAEDLVLGRRTVPEVTNTVRNACIWPIEGKMAAFDLGPVSQWWKAAAP